MKINVVPDCPCPTCGAYWGNPDHKLDYPNRPKVDDNWKCYNPECEVGYYHPRKGVVELKQSPEEMKLMAERIMNEMRGQTVKVINYCVDGEPEESKFVIGEDDDWIKERK